MKRSTTYWILGGAAVALGVGVYAYEKNKAATTPAVPPPTLQPGTMTAASTFLTGKNYGIASQLGTGVTTQALLVTALQATGWTNVQVIFFGPTAAGVVPAGLPTGLPPGATNTAWVASGTWNGTNNAPVPTGVLAVQMS